MPPCLKLLNGEISEKTACFCSTVVLNGKDHNLSYT